MGSSKARSGSTLHEHVRSMFDGLDELKSQLGDSDARLRIAKRRLAEEYMREARQRAEARAQMAVPRGPEPPPATAQAAPIAAESLPVPQAAPLSPAVPAASDRPLRRSAPRRRSFAAEDDGFAAELWPASDPAAPRRPVPRTVALQLLNNHTLWRWAGDWIASPTNVARMARKNRGPKDPLTFQRRIFKALQRYCDLLPGYSEPEN